MWEIRVWSLGQEDPLEKGMDTHSSILGLPCGSAGKEHACDGRDLGSVPGLGRSPGEGKGYPLQYPCLENPMDRGPGRWQPRWSQGVWHDWATGTHTSPLWAPCFRFSFDFLPASWRCDLKKKFQESDFSPSCAPAHTCLWNKVEVSVAQSCPSLGDPVDCSLPGSSVHGILQAGILEWVAMPSSRGSPRRGV